MSKKRKLSGGWAAILPLSAAMAGYLGLIFFPGMAEVRRLRAEIVEKQQFLTAGATRAARKTAVTHEEEELREYLRRWRGSSTSSADVARVLAEVTKRAREAGVATTAFRPEARQSFAVLERIPFTLSGVGTIEQLQTLPAAFEQMPERIWIDGISIGQDVERAPLLKIELRGAIFADNFPISD